MKYPTFKFKNAKTNYDNNNVVYTITHTNITCKRCHRKDIWKWTWSEDRNYRILCKCEMEKIVNGDPHHAPNYVTFLHKLRTWEKAEENKLNNLAAANQTLFKSPIAQLEL